MGYNPIKSNQKKVTPEYIAKKFLIKDFVYSNIAVYFGLDNFAYEYTLLTLMPISYTGEYAVVFCDTDGEVIYYASHAGNNVIKFIEDELKNFMEMMGKDRNGKIIVSKSNYWFDDEKKIRRCRDNEFADPI